MRYLAQVLDVGCGPGFYVAELLDTVGPEGAVAGVDRSREMLAVAAKRTAGTPNVGFHEAGATGLPFENESFDRALSVQVFEYVGDVPAALRSRPPRRRSLPVQAQRYRHPRGTLFNRRRWSTFRPALTLVHSVD
ncbi:MAG: methyltransferase domain-containing protein [Solirubrobacteraceae bacterium]